MKRTTKLCGDLPDVCRLGLATRGNTHLRPEDVEHAVDRGLNYLNWCGKPDGISHAVAGMGVTRKDTVVAVQFKSRTAEEAQTEFQWILDQLRTDYLDAATLYYVESEAEWAEIIAPGGVWEALAELQRQGALKIIGLTSHQRRLAAAWSSVRRRGGPPGLPVRSLKTGAPGLAVRSQVSGEALSQPDSPRLALDLLMIRYNAAHRGAEQDVFPTTRDAGIPVVTFTGLRWRALLEKTPDAPPEFRPPSAAECYRFCLANPDVSVALAAPGNRAELDHALTLLDDWTPPREADYEALCRHGDRVRLHAGTFW